MMGLPVCTTVPQASSAPTTAIHALPLDSSGAPTHVTVKTTDHPGALLSETFRGRVGGQRMLHSK